MNRKLLDIIGQTDEKYIAEAENYKRRPIVKIGAIAACLALAIIGAMFPWSTGKKPISASTEATNAYYEIPTTASDLPMLSIIDRHDSMGFEGFMAYDISEIVSNNPWREDIELETLPVFENTAEYNSHYEIIGSDFPAEEFKKEVASRMKPDGAEIGYHYPWNVYINFDEPVSLPDEYVFEHHMSYDEAENTAKYLLEQYSDLIAFEEPTVDIYYGDYNIYGQQSHDISFYEGKGDYVEDILAFNFNRVTFHQQDDGKLMSISVLAEDYFTMSKLGDYPIISLDEAKEKLKNGQLITTVPRDFEFDLSKPLKCELIYRAGHLDEIYMPYYRFYVELEGFENKGSEFGLKNFGAFYVPAVEEKYIENMPVWDGSFN
ncbi:MAG: hypothetical protein IJO16_01265 [Clostridia bacterium]|nr:hypothetical protein [Clostridia bacterium]MBQ7094361.1 hypothetical protein [Clostridia bacterium]